MIENVGQNPWLYIVGILSSIIIVKNAWIEVFIPLFKFLGIEIHSKQNKELILFKDEIKEVLNEIKLRLNDMEDIREEEKQLNRLTLKGVTASLYAHQQVGANGPVTIAIKEIEDYKLAKVI